MNAELLRRELNLIKNEALRGKVEEILRSIPECMEHKPSSSSGKYHPEFDRVDGGNINHTKAVVKVAEILMDATDYFADAETYKEVFDSVIAACILHDMMKYGTDPDEAEHTVSNHPILAAKLIEDYDPKIAGLIECHMGKWNGIKNEQREVVGYMPKPGNLLEVIVHFADLIASREWVSEKILED